MSAERALKVDTEEVDVGAFDVGWVTIIGKETGDAPISYTA